MRKNRSPAQFCLVVTAISGALLAAAAPLSAARKNDPNIRLEFDPQQTVAKAEAFVRGAMLERPVRLRLKDDRAGDDPAALGRRTNDDDEFFDLVAVGDDAVMKFVDEVLRDSVASWGVELAEGVPLELAVRLLKFDVLEKNQVIGATFNAEVRFAYSLGAPGGSPRMSGTAMGDATRYGRKFSNANINEVLSDALLEVIANMLSDRSLQDAWGE